LRQLGWRAKTTLIPFSRSRRQSRLRITPEAAFLCDSGKDLKVISAILTGISEMACGNRRHGRRDHQNERHQQPHVHAIALASRMRSQYDGQPQVGAHSIGQCTLGRGRDCLKGTGVDQPWSSQKTAYWKPPLTRQTELLRRQISLVSKSTTCPALTHEAQRG
jgi:hypothetical protein